VWFSVSWGRCLHRTPLFSGGPCAACWQRQHSPLLPLRRLAHQPTANLTDRGFTGHVHDNLGSAPEDIGLVYMAARRLFAICSARSPEYLLSVDYFREMGARVFPVTDSEGTSGVTAVTHLITQLIQQEHIDAFFTCGSNRLLKLLQQLGKQHNIPGQIALEQQMACGLGMCYCCVRTFVQNGKRVDLRVCKEGPVFDLQEALTW